MSLLSDGCLKQLQTLQLFWRQITNTHTTHHAQTNNVNHNHPPCISLLELPSIQRYWWNDTRPPPSSPASPTHCWGCGERQMMTRMKQNRWQQWRAIWASLQLQLARLARRTLWANATWVFFSMSTCNACTICSSRGILVRIFMVNMLLALNHGSFACTNSVGTTSSNIIGTYNIKLFPAHFCSVAPFRFDAPEAKVARVPQSHQSKQLEGALLRLLKLLHREQQIHNSVKGWNYRNGTLAHSRLYTAKWI